MSEQRQLPFRRLKPPPNVINEREELVERELTSIVGPLGIWHFPVLNALLMFLERLQQLRQHQYNGRRSRVTTIDLIHDPETGRVIQVVGVEKDF